MESHYLINEWTQKVFKILINCSFNFLNLTQIRKNKNFRGNSWSDMIIYCSTLISIYEIF